MQFRIFQNKMVTRTSDISGDISDKRQSKGLSRRTEAVVIISMLLMLAATIAVVVWQTNKIDQDFKHPYNKPTPAPRSGNVTWPKRSGSAVLTRDLRLKIRNGSRTVLEGILNWGINVSDPTECSTSSSTDICLEWKNDRMLTINFSHLTTPQLDCYDFQWDALACTDQELIDCYNISSAHWYGGYQDKIQPWPFETINRTMVAYVANDSYIGEIGGVLERYWFSSKGTGIFIYNDVPLYFSMNNPPELMCFSAKYDRYPYLNHDHRYPYLKYTICQADNVKDIHLKMTKLFIPKPAAVPDMNLFRYPIWSTWAQYHKNINQSNVLSYANAILQNNFTHAQIEIDDNWTPAYGDMEFDAVKFPNATDMIKDLDDLGFRVTVWVHPFFNLDSQSFIEAASQFFLIRAFESPRPALTSWWDGKLAGILDPSNPAAVTWYQSKLNILKTKYNVSSFKFDAGEAAWLPHIYSASTTPVNPGDIYPQSWVLLAATADLQLRQEVRVGHHTQKLPVFVRMMDKLSNWGHDNGIKSVIPCALTFGILGYPFVLPDMIGGNAYNNKPEPELYIRWLQLNTFLPSMQYSIPPWIYNDTVVEISQKFTKLHEQYSDLLIELAEESLKTAFPIIRPLWWLDPYSEDALNCEDEFLVGDKLLVAPVLERGARHRNIYIPAGSWHDEIHNVTVDGGKWILNFPVDLYELAYFTKVPVT